jgi:hypothetical protein
LAVTRGRQSEAKAARPLAGLFFNTAIFAALSR